MKRSFALLLVAIILSSVFFAFPAAGAVAEESSYLVIDRDNVYLYQNTVLQEPLFVIPKTFYVKLRKANLTSIYHLVEYNGVVGLVKTSEVSSTTYQNVANPYYTATTISPHIDAYLYDSPSFSAKTDIAAYGLSLTFLGKVQGENGTYGTQIWFAVLYTNQVYYIHSAKTGNLDLLESSFSPVHPNSVVSTATTAENGSSEGDSLSPADSFDTVRLILIIGMVVPIVIILFLLFRPRRKRRRIRNNRDDRYDAEEEEYDDY